MMAVVMLIEEQLQATLQLQIVVL